MTQSASDHTARTLATLQQTASTGRVLNLVAVHELHREEPDYRRLPLFVDRLMNTAVLMKHRLTVNDRDLLSKPRGWATKVIIPFDAADLGIGGRSFLVGQRGWMSMLGSVCREDRVAQAAQTLNAIDKLPSLDPFLLREHLKRGGFRVAECYFKISAADLAAMQSHVRREIAGLIEQAYPEAGAAGVARLAEALLDSSCEDDRLAPLRLTLRIEGDAFKEGVFAWKGFLYYKWALEQAGPKLDRILDQTRRLRPVGAGDPAAQAFAREAPAVMHQMVVRERAAIADTLKQYDAAFAELTAMVNPFAFRDFLVRAPDLFLTLGERLGALNHLTAFWERRFPPGAPLTASVQELVGLGQEFQLRDSPPDKPVPSRAA